MKTQRGRKPIFISYRMGTLEKADQVVLDKTQQAELQNFFGAPTVIVPSNKANRDVWIYCDPAPCSSGRLTLHIDRTSKVVKSILWRFQPKDGPVSSESLTKRYADVNFKKKKLILDYKHHFERVTILEDRSKGIAIQLSMDGLSALSVSRSSPSELPNQFSNQNKLPIVREEK